MSEYDVYGIHYNGELYRNHSRKSFYFKKAHAKNVISQDSRHIAHDEYGAKMGKSFYNLSREEQLRLINRVKDRFTIVPYVPITEVNGATI